MCLHIYIGTSQGIYKADGMHNRKRKPIYSKLYTVKRGYNHFSKKEERRVQDEITTQVTRTEKENRVCVIIPGEFISAACNVDLVLTSHYGNYQL